MVRNNQLTILLYHSAKDMLSPRGAYSQRFRKKRIV